ncbi:hypothetical protein CAEBREN_07036 [Caenorhabditis brenneri]|uniref:Uncharacterized protein n=1 Tax=Caenorhabditis brenneri TaxID=135651 RepID=G0NV49_CAEBE|nr:hypothetical protein CAEBREN_07036 [Caenorhabditis brenneri]
MFEFPFFFADHHIIFIFFLEISNVFFQILNQLFIIMAVLGPGISSDASTPELHLQFESLALPAESNGILKHYHILIRQPRHIYSLHILLLLLFTSYYHIHLMYNQTSLCLEVSTGLFRILELDEEMLRNEEMEKCDVKESSEKKKVETRKNSGEENVGAKKTFKEEDIETEKACGEKSIETEKDSGEEKFDYFKNIYKKKEASLKDDTKLERIIENLRETCQNMNYTIR